MSNSPLVDFTQISPNKNSPRNHKIDTITIHCYVGQVTVERMGKGFANPNKKASCNYGVALDGKIGMYVEEKDRSWCSSNANNDNRAITIEVACDSKHPYAVTDAAYNSLINLLVDICKRNNIKQLLWEGDKKLIGQVDKQNMTVHRWFANKACPGKYLYDRHGQIAEEVNAQLNKSTKMVHRVQIGAFRNKDYVIAMYDKVKAAGFDASVVLAGGLYKVQVGAYSRKANALATLNKLKKAGFDCVLSTQTSTPVTNLTAKTIEEIAKEVIAGKWGNGATRKARLTKAGYDPAEVQKKVNELL